MFDWASFFSYIGEHLPDYLMVIATTWVGWMAARIAGGQSKIQQEIAEVERQRVRLDLMDRRLVVYDAVWHYLSECVSRGERPGDTADAALQNLRPQVLFLFGGEMLAFVDEVRKRGSRLHLANAHIRMGRNVPEAAGQSAEILQWMSDTTKGLGDRFAPFLDFSSFSLPSKP